MFITDMTSLHLRWIPVEKMHLHRTELLCQFLEWIKHIDANASTVNFQIAVIPRIYTQPELEFKIYARLQLTAQCPPQVCLVY